MRNPDLPDFQQGDSVMGKKADYLEDQSQLIWKLNGEVDFMWIKKPAENLQNLTWDADALACLDNDECFDYVQRSQTCLADLLDGVRHDYRSLALLADILCDWAIDDDIAEHLSDEDFTVFVQTAQTAVIKAMGLEKDSVNQYMIAKKLQVLTEDETVRKRLLPQDYLQLADTTRDSFLTIVTDNKEMPVLLCHHAANIEPFLPQDKRAAYVEKISSALLPQSEHSYLLTGNPVLSSYISVQELKDAGIDFDVTAKSGKELQEELKTIQDYMRNKDDAVKEPYIRMLKDHADNLAEQFQETASQGIGHVQTGKLQQMQDDYIRVLAVKLKLQGKWKPE